MKRLIVDFRCERNLQLPPVCPIESDESKDLIMFCMRPRMCVQVKTNEEKSLAEGNLKMYVCIVALSPMTSILDLCLIMSTN